MVKRSGRRGSMSCAATGGYGWRSDGLRHSLRMVDRGSVSMAVSLTGLIMPVWYEILLHRILNSSSGMARACRHLWRGELLTDHTSSMGGLIFLKQ